MPRYNVQNPKGEWACYSSIADDFITDFMPKAEYEEWRKEEYGTANYRPAEECNVMEYEEAMQTKLCMEMHMLANECIDCSTCKFWNNETNKCEIVKTSLENI